MEQVITLPLSAVKAEAHRLMGGNPDLPRIDAYVRALAAVVMAAAEEPELTPFEQAVLAAVQRLQQGKLRDIRRELDLVGMSSVHRWGLWQTLVALEDRHLIYRPHGPLSKTWACMPITAAGQDREARITA